MSPTSRAIVVTLVLAALCAGSALNFLPARAVQAANSGPSETGAGPVVGRVYYADAGDLAQLARSLDIWEAHPAERYLVAQLSPARYAALIAQRARVWLNVTPAAGDTQPAAKTAVSVTFEAQSLPVGSYTSTLRIGSDDLARPAVYIPLTLTVTSACIPVNYLFFTYASPRLFSGQVVTFSASAGGAKPVAFSWDFGDGLAGASGPTAPHVFPPSIGDQDYAVTLNAQNACPSSVSVQWPVHVQPYRLAAPVLIK